MQQAQAGGWVGTKANVRGKAMDGMLAGKGQVVTLQAWQAGKAGSKAKGICIRRVEPR